MLLLSHTWLAATFTWQRQYDELCRMQTWCVRPHAGHRRESAWSPLPRPSRKQSTPLTNMSSQGESCFLTCCLHSFTSLPQASTHLPPNSPSHEVFEGWKTLLGLKGLEKGVPSARASNRHLKNHILDLPAFAKSLDPAVLGLFLSERGPSLSVCSWTTWPGPRGEPC